MIARRYDYRQKYVSPVDGEKLQEWEAALTKDSPERVRFFSTRKNAARDGRMLLGMANNDGRIFYMRKISHDIGASA